MSQQQQQDKDNFDPHITIACKNTGEEKRVNVLEVLPLVKLLCEENLTPAEHLKLLVESFDAVGMQLPPEIRAKANELMADHETLTRTVTTMKKRKKKVRARRRNRGE